MTTRLSRMMGPGLETLSGKVFEELKKSQKRCLMNEISRLSTLHEEDEEEAVAAAASASCSRNNASGHPPNGGTESGRTIAYTDTNFSTSQARPTPLTEATTPTASNIPQSPSLPPPPPPAPPPSPPTKGAEGMTNNSSGEDGGPEEGAPGGGN